MRHERVSHEKMYDVHPCYTVRHQYSNRGNHRIIVTDPCGKQGTYARQVASGWTNYDIPATVDHLFGIRFVATTDHWLGIFPRVFRIDEGKP